MAMGTTPVSSTCIPHFQNSFSFSLKITWRIVFKRPCFKLLLACTPLSSMSADRRSPLIETPPVFSTAPEHFYFGVWVALEDANAENGAMQIYRGGHAIPELDREAWPSGTLVPWKICLRTLTNCGLSIRTLSHGNAKTQESNQNCCASRRRIPSFGIPSFRMAALRSATLPRAALAL